MRIDIIQHVIRGDTAEVVCHGKHKLPQQNQQYINDLRIPTDTAKMALVVGNQLPPKQKGVLTEDHQVEQVERQQKGPLLELRERPITHPEDSLKCCATYRQDLPEFGRWF